MPTFARPRTAVCVRVCTIHGTAASLHERRPRFLMSCAFSYSAAEGSTRRNKTKCLPPRGRQHTPAPYDAHLPTHTRARLHVFYNAARNNTCPSSLPNTRRHVYGSPLFFCSTFDGCRSNARCNKCARIVYGVNLFAERPRRRCRERRNYRRRHKTNKRK